MMTLPNDSTSPNDPARTTGPIADAPGDEAATTLPTDSKREPATESHTPATDGPVGEIPGTVKQSTPWPMRVWPWALIFIVALMLRFGYVNQIRSVPFFDSPVGDAAAYDAWAHAIVDGDWASREYTHGLTFYQAPAYPYFLAGVYAAFGDAPATIRQVQALLGAVSCLLLGFAAARFIGRRVGIVAAALLALYAPAIFFDGLIQKTTLATFWMTLLLWLMSCQLRRPALWRFVVAGVVLGLFGLTRENALVLVAALLIWIWADFRGAGYLAKRNWSASVIFGLLLVFYPVAVRNYFVADEWAISTSQAGPNFYIGNHAGATGRYTPLALGHETPEFERSDAKRLAEDATGKQLSDLEVSRYWLSQAWVYIRSAPAEWARLVGTKFLLAINRYEINDTEGYNVYRMYSWMLGGLIAPVMHFGVIAPLAAVGFVLTLRHWRRVGVLYLMALLLIIAIVAFYVFARYRFPLVPIAIIFAAAGIVGLYECVLERRVGAIVAAVIVGIAAAVVANIRVSPEQRLDAMSLANVGTVVAQRGNLDAAMQLFEQAVITSPESPEPYYNIGMVYRLKGQTRGAIEYFMEAKKRAPGLAEVDFQIAQCLEADGNTDAALRFYQAALTNNPNDTEAADGIQRLMGNRP
ncbi:MAG: glycosyltransferase family 39 protein [Phycisphaerales bacterium]|nr:glycosyltransferase family 39 protein [Phycisphaerales bacterium]